MFSFVGRSADGARRTYGRGKTEAEAGEQVQQATFEYLQGRPDLGPMSAWKFTLGTDADLAAVTFSRDV